MFVGIMSRFHDISMTEILIGLVAGFTAGIVVGKKGK
jgi:hypothetical protein